MKHNEKGFSILEIVLVLIVIVLVGGASWYVFKKQNDSSTGAKNNQKVTPELVNYTDSSKTFSFRYPNTWAPVPYVTPGHDGPARPEPDWSKTPQPITLRNQKNKHAEIRITGYKDVATTVDREIESINKDQFNTHAKVTINNYPAIKHVLDFVGPSGAEKYKDTTYIILVGTNKVTLQFRERYSNSTINGQNDFNASELYPDFEQIVKSIKF